MGKQIMIRNINKNAVTCCCGNHIPFKRTGFARGGGFPETTDDKVEMKEEEV